MLKYVFGKRAVQNTSLNQTTLHTMLFHKLAGVFMATAAAAQTQFYPLTKNAEIPVFEEIYEIGQDMLMDCISRNIDNGEHNFDSQDRIIYLPFPICKETGKPLTFQYGVSNDTQCTINFSDELYHLFQLYIHEDAPLSCRIPLSPEANYLEKGGAYVPLTFNFRGEVHDSHLDIDSGLNVLFIKPNSRKPEQNLIVASTAFSSSTNVTRVVIGDDLTLNLAVRWLDNINNVGSLTSQYDPSVVGLPFADGFYSFPMNSIPLSFNGLIGYLAIAVLLSSVITLVCSYNIINSKSKKRYIPLDHESHLSKQD